MKLFIVGGGGVYGAIPSYFLDRAEIGDTTKFIDVYAGTSVGGIIAIYLSQGRPAREFYDIFVNEIDDLFATNWFRKANPFIPTYSEKKLEKALQRNFDGTIGDLKKNIVVPTLNFRQNRYKVYDNMEQDEDLLVPLWEVARATSAAPTYFLPFGPNIFLDGGILENITVVTAATAIRSKMGIPFDEIDVFVMGCGKSDKEVKKEGEADHYTKLHWLAKLIVPYVTRANEISSVFWGENLGFKSFTYFNPVQLSGSLDDKNAVKDGTIAEESEKFVEDFKSKWEYFILR